MGRMTGRTSTVAPVDSPGTKGGPWFHRAAPPPPQEKPALEADGQLGQTEIQLSLSRERPSLSLPGRNVHHRAG